MRWIAFMFLLVIVLTGQSTLACRIEFFGARPDWLLVTVVFFALFAREREATIGGWIIGGCADLMTIERFGLLALSYGVVAMGVVSVREYIFRYRMVPQFVVTLVACLVVRLALIIYHRTMYDPGRSLPSDLITHVLLASFYTAGWGPLVCAGLLRMSRTFGLPQPRYTYMGLK